MSFCSGCPGDPSKVPPPSVPAWGEKGVIKVLQTQIHLPQRSGDVASQVPGPKAWPSRGACVLPGAPAHLPLLGGHSRSGSGRPLGVGLVLPLSCHYHEICPRRAACCLSFQLSVFHVDATDLRHLLEPEEEINADSGFGRPSRTGGPGFLASCRWRRFWTHLCGEGGTW